MDLSELEPEVSIEVPGVARFAVLAAISASAREFFLESRAWRVDFGPLEVAPVLRPKLPTDTFLVEAVAVRIDDAPLLAGQFVMDNDNGIELIDARTGTFVRGTVAVAPTPFAEELPDRLGNEFRDALVAGALFRLLRTPGAEWSNGQLALYYQGIFEVAKDRAATRAEDGFTKKRTRTVRYGGY